MKNIVMAAGYATRLYPLTKNFPKPLLQIGDNTILGRLIDDIDTIPEISEHIIVTNHKFAGIFNQWAKDRQTTTTGSAGSSIIGSFHDSDSTDSNADSASAASPAVSDSFGSVCNATGPSSTAGTKSAKPITIIDDGTQTNETRLGAVRDLLLAIDRCHIDEDILVIAADNILDFSFKGFIDYFHKKNTSLIMCHHEPELKRLQRTGVIRVDNDQNLRVLEMQEKPEHPASHWAVPPFYLYKRSDLPLIRSIIDASHTTKTATVNNDGDTSGTGNRTVTAADFARLYDAPGSLVKYLCPLTPIHAYPMPGRRFDIGSLDSYEEAKTLFGEGKR